MRDCSGPAARELRHLFPFSSYEIRFDLMILEEEKYVTERERGGREVRENGAWGPAAVV